MSTYRIVIIIGFVDGDEYEEDKIVLKSGFESEYQAKAYASRNYRYVSHYIERE